MGFLLNFKMEDMCRGSTFSRSFRPSCGSGDAGFGGAVGMRGDE